jgi:hypothetical protein
MKERSHDQSDQQCLTRDARLDGQAFADAWGKALDTQADVITTKSDVVSQGGDKPSDITQLTAESMRMSFMANSSHSSIDSVSKALETMARKN